MRGSVLGEMFWILGSPSAMFFLLPQANPGAKLLEAHLLVQLKHEVLELSYVGSESGDFGF